MPLIDAKCPTCGAAMKFVDNQLFCSHCETIMLAITEPKIDKDYKILSATELEEELKNSSQRFIVNIKNNISVFDVDVLVINKKIKDATEALAKGDYSDVLSMIKCINLDVFSIYRLGFLAKNYARSESELLRCESKLNMSYYDDLIRLADEQTRLTYEKIIKHCNERYKLYTEYKQKVNEMVSAMVAEINRVNELLAVGLMDESLTYAKEMCKKYPDCYVSWKNLSEVKYALGNTYLSDEEYEKIVECEGYDVTNDKLPKHIAEHNRNAKYLFDSCEEDRKCINSRGWKICAWLMTILIEIILVPLTVVGGVLLSFGVPVAAFFMYNNISEIQYSYKGYYGSRYGDKKSLKKELPFLPHKLRERYSKSKYKLWLLRLCFWGAIVGIIAAIAIIAKNWL